MKLSDLRECRARVKSQIHIRQKTSEQVAHLASKLHNLSTFIQGLNKEVPKVPTLSERILAQFMKNQRTPSRPGSESKRSLNSYSNRKQSVSYSYLYKHRNTNQSFDRVSYSPVKNRLFH